jgi:malate dehydrogenase (oxaloacetate-decarboxylating)
MLWEACKALSVFDSKTPERKNALLPNFENIQAISRSIALAVAIQARQEGLAKVKESFDLAQEIDRQFWYPEYVNYAYSSSV